MESFDLVDFLFLILTLLSIVIGIYAYKKSKRIKKIVFEKKTSKIISKMDFPYSKLNFEFGGHQIESLMVTKFCIWNYGQEAIRESDFIETDYLRINSIDETLIYDFQLKVTNLHNQVKLILIKENELKLNFKYLNSGEGMIVEIFHSGTNSKGLRIAGSFIGADEILEAPDKSKYMTSFLNSKYIDYMQKIIDGITFMPLKFIAIIVLLMITIPVVAIVFLFVGPLDYINNFGENALPTKLKQFF